MFNEFSNPEGTDYDINSSLDGINMHEVEPHYQNTSTYEQQLMAILEEIGLLDEEDFEKAGITEAEYINPNAETIVKMEAYRDQVLAERKAR